MPFFGNLKFVDASAKSKFYEEGRTAQLFKKNLFFEALTIAVSIKMNFSFSLE